MIYFPIFLSNSVVKGVMVFVVLIIQLNAAMTCAAQDVSAEKTITYQFITSDSILLGSNKTEVSQCVDFLNVASSRIRRNFPKMDFKKIDKAAAICVLATIDSIFTEFGFLFYTDPKDIQYDFLTMAFRKSYNPERVILANSHREKYWRTLGKKQCKLIDCDLYCFIYLGLAEMNNLPLSMVELPQHNFIRWNFNDGKFIDWEVIEGAYHPSDSTLSCYWHLNDINKKYYLRAWDASETLSYYYTLRGATFDYNKLFLNSVKAKRDYEKAIYHSSKRAVTFNNLVWISVVNPAFDNEFNLPKLLAMMDTAINLLNDRNYYDTKAGLYAQAGDFRNAIACLEQGITVENDPDNVVDTCKKHLEWFKQGITIIEGNKTEKLQARNNK